MMNKQYSIMGVSMSKAQAQRLRFVVVNQIQQGWRPTQEDIKRLLYADEHPDASDEADMKKLRHELRRDA